MPLSAHDRHYKGHFFRSKVRIFIVADMDIGLPCRYLQHLGENSHANFQSVRGVHLAHVRYREGRIRQRALVMVPATWRGVDLTGLQDLSGLAGLMIKANRPSGEDYFALETM
jgi:hypothetical protein